MSYSKRKWEEIDDSDEEEPAYGKQILPVANLPQDFNDEPVDGLQYLFVVRRDARQLPSTVRAPNPYERPEPETSILTVIEQLQPGSPPLLPSEEWRLIFERRFLNFRKNFAQPTTYVGPISLSKNASIPDRRERGLWWSFLAGKPHSEWNPSKRSELKSKKQQLQASSYTRTYKSTSTYKTTAIATDSWINDEGEVEDALKIDPADTLPSPAGSPIPLDYLEAISQPSSTSVSAKPELSEDQMLAPREPTSHILKLIDEVRILLINPISGLLNLCLQRAALHLLMYFTYWINLHLSSPETSTYVLTESHGRWIFFLLSRIDDFISPDDMNLLRNLARACISLLKHVRKQENENGSAPPKTSAPEVMSDSSCWIIITIVAGIWKQKDLWMDAEDALRSS
ncbi:hypothetical protein BDN70DRAFT_908994 [Pholiota conissans]|uniref:Uncharacterized protein n=1 Tax=Pholiota conissans TaxID=109636 RepID=A0A9P5YNC7_9AGAR|nr:hypothetical protein BDN70DRAFT_908994 [Pholiota conissans]